MRRIFRWWLSLQLAVGMFPSWYGPPQRDWSPQIRLTGFPMYDGKPAAEMSPELAQFCQAGAPPIAFTFGTGMMHGVKLFRAAVESCVKLGRRGLLLSKYGDKLPADLPSCIRHVEYAPFQKLFPLCAAVVHHGGIGTTAKALAAGTPQLVVPLAFDQLDNALRVKRIGAGNFIKPKGLTGGRLAAALAPLLEEPARRCSSAVRLRMQNQPDGLCTAADLVSALPSCLRSA